MPLKLTSTKWRNGETIPVEFTADGADVSPPLHFEGVPAGTVSFALVCDDPDAPAGTWVHWVIYDIPGVAKSLPPGVPPEPTLRDGTHQGKNSWGKIGYGGPSPPSGPPHRYRFRLYALRAALNSPPALGAREIEGAARAKSLEMAELQGTYGRP